MKFNTTAMLSLLAAYAQAWELTVTMTDGRHVTTHGTFDSGCETYDFASKQQLITNIHTWLMNHLAVTKPVNKAVFKESTFAKTFELYEQAGCGGRVSYRENGGTHTLVPRTIKSYKVY